MAITYVKEFSFPSDFGFHKNGSCSVPGKAKGGHIKASTPQAYAKGGSTTPQPYRKGGEVQGPQTKFPGHTKKADAKPHTGAGASNLSYVKRNDSSPPKTTSEKTSGVQAPAFKRGGKAERNAGIHAKHMERRAKGGSISADIADAPVPMGKKSSWNKDDAVSPGSAKRTPPKQGMKNQAAARNKFATDGENTEPATKQEGDVHRMSGWSDFKKGGKVHKKAAGGQIKTEDRFERSESHEVSAPDKQSKGDGMMYKSGGRIKNLGHYAHGGKVWKDGSTQKPGGDAKYEKAAGTPKRDHMATKGERPSGKAEGKHTEKAQGTHRRNGSAKHEAHMAMGGLSRGTSAKKNAAIHAKNKAKSPGAGALASLLGSSMGQAPHQPMGPGVGPSPPGMAPGMGSPPGGPMGGMAPPPGPGAPAMSHGGGVKHTFVHYVHHGKG
jgi:hypothetical protein